MRPGWPPDGPPPAGRSDVQTGDIGDRRTGAGTRLAALAAHLVFGAILGAFYRVAPG
jgi:hypothetical protein